MALFRLLAALSLLGATSASAASVPHGSLAVLAPAPKHFELAMAGPPVPHKSAPLPFFPVVTVPVWTGPKITLLPELPSFEDRIRPVSPMPYPRYGYGFGFSGVELYIDRDLFPPLPPAASPAPVPLPATFWMLGAVLIPPVIRKAMKRS